jgi:hypothetical protein
LFSAYLASSKAGWQIFKFKNYLPRAESSEKIISRGLSHRAKSKFFTMAESVAKISCSGLSLQQNYFPQAESLAKTAESMAKIVSPELCVRYIFILKLS